MSAGNPGAMARAVGQIGYGARSAAFGANKDIAAAAAMNKSEDFKKLSGTSAYGKGPKA